MSISDCKLIDIPTFSDERGSLSVLEASTSLPFEIKRVYYLTQVPDNSVRGSHAHKSLRQLIIALSGSFVVDLFDGKERASIKLDSASKGLMIVPWIWRELRSFSSQSVCLVLASEEYIENDYIHCQSEFIRAVSK